MSISLAGCVSSGKYTRAAVVTPQTLDCGAAGLAFVKVWSPAEAQLSFQGRTYTLERDPKNSAAYYKGGGAEYSNSGVTGLIRVDGSTHRCDVRPRDLEPEPMHPAILPEGEQRVPRLDVTPYL